MAAEAVRSQYMLQYYSQSLWINFDNSDDDIINCTSESESFRLCSLTYRDTDCYLRCYHRFVKRRQSFTSDNNTDEPVLT